MKESRSVGSLSLLQRNTRAMAAVHAGSRTARRKRQRAGRSRSGHRPCGPGTNSLLSRPHLVFPIFSPLTFKGVTIIPVFYCRSIGNERGDRLVQYSLVMHSSECLVAVSQWRRPRLSIANATPLCSWSTTRRVHTRRSRATSRICADMSPIALLERTNDKITLSWHLSLPTESCVP